RNYQTCPDRYRAPPRPRPIAKSRMRGRTARNGHFSEKLTVRLVRRAAFDSGLDGSDKALGTLAGPLGRAVFFRTRFKLMDRILRHLLPLFSSNSERRPGPPHVI